MAGRRSGRPAQNLFLDVQEAAQRDQSEERRADGEHVEGLTTAAAMLFSAAVGSAVGLRLFVLAIGATLLALLTLRGLLRVEERLFRRPPVPPPGQ